MADETYNLHYKGDNSDLLGKTNVIVRALRLLDQVADRLIAKLGKLFTQPGRSAGTAAKSFDKAAASLKSVESAARGAGEAMKSVHGSNVKVTASAGGVTTSLGGILTGALALSAARGAVELLADAFKDAREFAHECAEEVLKLNDSVRELRMTTGKDTKEATAEVVGLMLKSGATEKQATDFDTLWESTVPAAKKKGNWGLNDAETRDAKEQALAYAVASGMDPKTIGEVMPLIGVGEKVTSADQVLGKMGTMGRLAVEGVGNLNPMMKVYEKLRGTMVRPEGGGAFRSSEELMGAISATSVESGNVPKVTQAMDQVWRDISFADNGTKEKTFAKYGLTAGDDYQTRIKKLAPIVAAARASGQSELGALKEAGFTRLGSNPKLIKEIFNTDVLDANLAIARGAPDGGGVRKFNEKFRDEQPNRFAENAELASKLHRGEETVDLEVLRKNVEAGLRNHDRIDRPGSNFLEDLQDLHGFAPKYLGMAPARERTLDTAVAQGIRTATPGAAARFGDRLSGATGADLAALVRDLKPDEKKKLNDYFREFAQPPGAKANANANARVPAAANGLGAAPAAPGAAAAGGDPRVVSLLEEQLREQKTTNAKLGGGPGAPPRLVPKLGPLPVDAPDGGPRRGG